MRYFYKSTEPHDLLSNRWTYIGNFWYETHGVYNPFYNQSCGDYTLVYLGHRAKGKDLSDFFKHFSKHDWVQNYHKAGEMLKRLIEEEISQEEWHVTSKKGGHQTTCHMRWKK